MIIKKCLDLFFFLRILKWVFIFCFVEFGFEWCVMIFVVFEFVFIVCFLFWDMIYIIGIIYMELE